MANLHDKGRGKPISKQAAYSKAASHFSEALDTILDVMRNGDNDNARLGAANKIIDKVLPNLKATELTGDGGNRIKIEVVRYDSNKNTSPTETRTSS